VGTIAGSKEEQINKTFKKSKLQLLYRSYDAATRKRWERADSKNILGWTDADFAILLLRFPLVLA